VILDTSAAMSLLVGESDAPVIGAALSSTERRAISAASLVELYLVAGGRGGDALLADAGTLVREFGIEVVPFTAEHAVIARDGWRRFGKGRHPAALNLGDCFSYALAKARGEPLLFKGDDFSRTDVRAAIASDA